MLGAAKTWLVNKCWSAFSLDKWKKRSQTVSVLVGVAFLLSVIAVCVALLTNADYRTWRKSGAVVLVPKDSIVTIQGASYIPIRMI